MDYFVYIWNDEKGTPYYVGEGCNDRWFQKRGIPRPTTTDLIQVFHLPSKRLCRDVEEDLIEFFGLIKDGGTLMNTARGRAGVKSIHAKLTEDQVKAIRIDARTLLEISKEYGISQSTVSRIKHKKCYQDIDSPTVMREALGPLTEDEVRAIKVDKRAYFVIAADYSIKPGTVSDIKSGASYAHLANDVESYRPGNGKLTDEQVLAIRADSRSLSKIARDYNININTVFKIKHRILHKHLT